MSKRLKRQRLMQRLCGLQLDPTRTRTPQQSLPRPRRQPKPFVKAAAEVQQDEMLSHTSWDQQESLLASYSDMVVQSNNGVEKIVDMGPNLNRDSPFAMEVSRISTWTCVLFQILVSQPLPSRRQMAAMERMESRDASGSRFEYMIQECKSNSVRLVE
jgi:hypothetical protein